MYYKIRTLPNGMIKQFSLNMNIKLPHGGVPRVLWLERGCDFAGVSTVFSKLVEMAILEDSSEHDFNMLQFGFVAKRSSNTAISLANDVNQ